jgi:ABC-type lipoprotein export system ATPase subunit
LDVQARYPEIMALLEVDHVSKHYSTDGEHVVALRDFSLLVAAGQLIAIVGRSGCGKSTLLNLCGAMDQPSSGAVVIDGVSTNSLTDAALTRLRREKVGFIFQSFQLLHTLSVVENVELPLLLAGRQGARKHAVESLSWVEMDTFANRLPHQLSGGQQQRVAIARALVHGPRLLLADEPTGNLDTATAGTVLSILRRTATDLGMAILMATHSVEFAAIADRVIGLRDGVLDGAPAPMLGRT